MNPQVEQAIEILKSGRPEAAEQALEQLQEAAFSFGKKFCGNHEDAEDIAQETLLRLAKSLEDFPNAQALAVWLYKVAKTQCLMSRRKSKFAPREMLPLEALMPRHDEKTAATSAFTWPTDVEKALLDKEFRERLEKAILALPARYRMVLILRDMEQLDTREAAKVLGLSPQTVKMRLHRARAAVRNTLESYFRSEPLRWQASHG